MSKKPSKPEKPAPGSSVQSALAVEAHHLRVALREISHRFVNDLESEIVRAIEMAGDVADDAAKQAALRKIIGDVQELEIKIHKGRLGDLKRLRNLVRDMNERLEDLL